MEIGQYVVALESSSLHGKDRNFWEAGDTGYIVEIDEDREQTKVKFDIAQCGTGIFWVPTDLLKLLPKKPKIHKKNAPAPNPNEDTITSSDKTNGTCLNIGKRRKYPDKDHRPGKVVTIYPKELEAQTQTKHEDPTDRISSVDLGPRSSFGLECDTQNIKRDCTPIKFGRTPEDDEKVESQLSEKSTSRIRRAILPYKELPSRVNGIKPTSGLGPNTRYKMVERKNLRIQGMLMNIEILERKSIPELLSELGPNDSLLFECPSDKRDQELANLATASKKYGNSQSPPQVV